MADYSAVQRVTVAQIQAAVCEEWGCDLATLVTSRLRPIARARQVAMYLARRLTLRSHENIARIFDNRDHATVHWAVNQVTVVMMRDPVFALRVTALEARLQPAELVEHF
jgi:chromosomal replication initiator protein